MFNRHPIAATEAAIETETSMFSLFGTLTTDLVVLGGTLGLAFVGVAITYVNKDLSYLYWLTMVPVFGTLCFVAQWSRNRATEVKWSRLFLTELLHWGGLLLAVALTYTLLSAGKIPRDTTGMVILLLFALVTFLYGVHLDRRFLGVGIFLGLSYVVMTYLAAYIWVVLVIAALAVSAAIFLVKRAYSQQAGTSPVTHDVPGTAGVTSGQTQEVGGVRA
ncbi:MAG: hypothetical protein ACREXX_14920 [Gammaproteobacteria bacterium]